MRPSPLIVRIMKSLNSYHFQVASRAGAFFDNNNVTALVNSNKSKIMPLIMSMANSSVYTQLEVGPDSNAMMVSKHWNEQVRDCFDRFLMTMLEIDRELCQEILRGLVEKGALGRAEARQSSYEKSLKKIYHMYTD